uniref:Late expression factor 2 n=1 Tax=Orgyia ericae nucleopolyhedrovirus TaxID=260683 RepID=Q700Q8_9ABAC|nr:late expression factor 2 [Orgyia ericae nucleopolyhedrovirus]
MATATRDRCLPSMWSPSFINNTQLIDKTKDYLVPVEDVHVEIGPYTRFERGGLYVRLSGLRLFYLLKAKSSAGANAVVPNARVGKKSCRNVCFAATDDKRNVAKLIRSKLKLPPCMEHLLRSLERAPRGDRFKKRFVFNCYIANLLTCTKCRKECLISAMKTLYDYDDKCVREFESMLKRDENDMYKPPNCCNMKRDKMCFKSQTCKGANPLCNK